MKIVREDFSKRSNLGFSSLRFLKNLTRRYSWKNLFSAQLFSNNKNYSHYSISARFKFLEKNGSIEEEENKDPDNSREFLHRFACQG